MEQFNGAPHVAVRTFRSSGQPVSTPVWAVVDNEKLYFGTPEHTHKVERIRADPRVQVALSDSRGNTTGSWIDGHARLLTSDEFAPHRRRIDKQHRIGSTIFRVVERLRGWNYIGVEITAATPD
jgi:PPOX class probable F420-dependent enzyme